MNTIQKIEAARFVADVRTVEALAHEYFTGAAQVRALDGTYLRILVAATQSLLGKGRRKLDADAQVGAVDKAAQPFYEAVLRGCTTPDVAPDDTLPRDEQVLRSLERNRRTAFARSSKSTLVAFARAGGDVRGLDVPTVTKASLREFVNAGRDEEQAANRTIVNAHHAILRVISREAEDDVDAARDRLEGVIEMLQTALEGLPQAHSHTQTHAASTMVRPRPTHQAPAMLQRGA